MKRKLLSLLLAAVMVATVFNSVALAAETEENEKEIPQAACELCGHIHDENCGYIASVEGVPCFHIHDDACGFTEGAQPKGQRGGAGLESESQTIKSITNQENG